MPALRKILIATDFSEHSEVAVAQATAIARREGREIILLHVDTERTASPPEIAVSERSGRDLQSMVGMGERDIRDQLERIIQTIHDAGVSVKPRIEHGHADEAIVRVADEIDIDLIVLGTHGHHSFLRMLLGSVVEKVVRMSTTSMLVARGKLSQAKNPIERILVPTDFSGAAHKALELAMAMAAPSARFEVLHAWHYPLGSRRIGKQPAKLRSKVVDNNKEHADQLLARYADSNFAVEFRQQYGPAAVVIQDRCEEDSFDLVALGTHGHRGFRRLLLGSVTESTIRHANCSVLVAHAERELRTA